MSLETQKIYDLAISALSILDENVISDDDYYLIKDKNPNIESELKYISDTVVKPWFLESEPSRRQRIVQSLIFIIENNENGVDIVFNGVNFVFDYDIEDKLLFLKRIKCFFEEYIINSE
ncbi:hypothetical protein OI450_00330 [Pectobacterium cacticida]|uniref:Uncharacterized protein n=1 Tax=Pectobacterium cacticida TaxID=69221 RepID=A0ABZ2GA09_9GAMM|nr:hypothetical protein [Pectobacterium cacticida]UYX06934.1 hypothetical protein OI450_00330 [Pectobacterium cacticida]